MVLLVLLNNNVIYHLECCHENQNNSQNPKGSNSRGRGRVLRCTGLRILVIVILVIKIVVSRGDRISYVNNKKTRIHFGAL